MQKNPCFCHCIILHTGITIQMIFTQIEHCSHIGIQIMGRLQLKAGCFKHPGLRPITRIHALHERIQNSRANISCYFHIPTRFPQHSAYHGGNRCFSIGSCNRHYLRLGQIALLKRPSKKHHVAHNRYATLHGLPHARIC